MTAVYWLSALIVSGADLPIIHLLNGKDLSPFYSWIKDEGMDRDPNKVFSYENGMLRVSGQQLGYLATRNNYSNYRLVAEYKWGHVGTNYDSGIWVHAIGPDLVWMHGVECNIKKAGTGVAFMYPRTVTKPDGSKTTEPGRYRKLIFPNRETLLAEKPVGEWNIFEVVCEGSRVRVLVNGQLVSEGTDAEPHAGKINLQSNLGEIFFRRLDLHPLEGFSAQPVSESNK